MTRRGIIQLSGTPKIRISKPGTDVDVADDTGFLLHENHLYAQPYFFQFVACPFAGNTSYVAKNQSVDVTIPDIDGSPIVLLWPVDSAGNITSPIPRSTGPGSSQFGFAVENWNIYWKIISSTSMTIKFTKTIDSLRSPNGCYVVLIRKPL